jgi:hypothetical protein
MLTKILIVLLTISSIFLGGIVVTYVANADNYRQMYTGIKAEKDSAVKKEQSASSELNTFKDETNRQKQQLNSTVDSLKGQVDQLQRDLQTVQTEKDDAVRKMNSWETIVMGFTKTTDSQGQLLKNTLGELDKLRTEQIKKDRELKQTENTLLEKMVIISTLDQKAKRLLEEKTELQNRLNQLLRQYGKAAAPTAPVMQKPEEVRTELPLTQKPDRGRTALPVAKDVGLNGRVTAVDPKNSMAEISIGSAHGVAEDMKFHVTRGDEFICDILILDVDVEKAVGILDLVQQMPQVGDNVSSNL